MRIATTSLALHEKAHKTYKHALEALRDRRQDIALDEFKKADKQDGGHCRGCQKQMINTELSWADGKLPSSPRTKLPQKRATQKKWRWRTKFHSATHVPEVESLLTAF